MRDSLHCIVLSLGLIVLSKAVGFDVGDCDRLRPTYELVW